MVIVDIDLYNKLLEVLESSEIPDTSTQKYVSEFLENFDKSHADSALYFLEASLSSKSIHARQMAALRLKNCIKNGNISGENLTLLKDGLKKALVTSDLVNVFSGCFAALFGILGFKNWPDGVRFLLSMLDNNITAVSGTLTIIVEDCISENSEPFNIFLVNELIPKLMSISILEGLPFVCRILGILLDSEVGRRHLLDEKFGEFWQYLCNLGTCNDAAVCKFVVTSMGKIWNYHPAHLLASSEGVFRYICLQIDHERASVRLEAVDFWSNILKVKEDSECNLQLIRALEPILPMLAKSLLDRTRYTDWDYMSMDESHFENDNADVPDNLEDIKPTRSCRDDSADGDDDFVEISGNTWGNVWTVRKGAALALDNLALLCGNDARFIQLVIGLIESKFASSDWEEQESAVLVLGAIAPGCLKLLAPMISRVLPKILLLTRHDKPLMRSIALWCASRFCPWVSHSSNCLEWVPKVIEALLGGIMDRNKRVQEAACSSLAIFMEETQSNFGPNLVHIVATMTRALDYYKQRNIMILYDTIGTLFEFHGHEIVSLGLGGGLLEKLVNSGLMIEINSPQFLSLIDCWNLMVAAVGVAFHEHILKTLEHCIKTLVLVLNDNAMVLSGASDVDVNWSVFEVSTDFVASAIQALGNNVMASLSKVWLVSLDGFPHYSQQVGTTACELDLILVHGAMQSQKAAVVQSVLAAIGHVCWICPCMLKCTQVLMLITNSLVAPVCAVANNAAWALGNFASQNVLAHLLIPLYEPMCHGLVHILQRWSQNRLLVQNALTTLSKITLLNPNGMLPFVSLVLPQWGEKLLGFLQSTGNDVEMVPCIEALLNLVAMDPIHMQLIPAALIQVLKGHSDPAVKTALQKLLGQP
ncbi:bifunctional Armadillo-type fold/Importin beta family/Armadillo-like helical [Babesia duncani]|uniref:Bifunctional Armadillo-type fold/Importin beta family/Armadillo-like helical n=1 Tax=Babesia duncani TaxID=323732 RepID=A0AAD9PPE8_9APIC|nr:bifunctional Armadillo-type fold/Importin beta family/Armadillo-like helical [Babesia duncani]